MSDPVELFGPRALRLVEAEIPSLPPEVRAGMDRTWDRAVRAKPALFDGPAVACLGLEREEDTLLLRWARVSYRYRALRRVPGAPWLPTSVFVTVLQPTDEGTLVVGRPSGWTAEPGRWTLPGGGAEPPADGAELGVPGLRGHAARELFEETGIKVVPDDLNLFAVSRGRHGSIGVHFLAPRLPEQLVLDHHARLCEAEIAGGGEPELDRLATVGSEAETVALGRVFDYLPPLVARFTALEADSA